MNNRMWLRLKAAAAPHDLGTEEFPFSLQTFVARLGVIKMVGHFVYYENFRYLLVLQQPKKKCVSFWYHYPLSKFRNTDCISKYDFKII